MRDSALAFDHYQFAGRPNVPVHAELTADGTFESTGIAYEDYSRMQTQTHKASGARRLPTPEWALNSAKLRAVVTRAYEMRADFKYQQPGTEWKRLRRAQDRLQQLKPSKLAALDRLCKQFLEMKAAGEYPARIRRLKSQIEGLDTSIVLADRGPGLIAAIVYYYYHLRLDSPGVSAALGGVPKPMTVRQILFRLPFVWAQVQNPRVPLTPEEKKAYNRECYCLRAAEKRRALGTPK